MEARIASSPSAINFRKNGEVSFALDEPQRFVRGKPFRAFRSVEQLSAENRRFAEPRPKVVASTSALQERERGAADRAASPAAQTGMAVCSYGVISWLDDPSETLRHPDRAFHELRTLSSAGSEPAR